MLSKQWIVRVARVVWLILCWFSMTAGALAGQAEAPGQARVSIEAAYIPLADHYAAIIAYERYREQMQHADFKITQIKNWDLLRAYFLGSKADMAFVMGPLAMDMFSKNPMFRWVGLMHRDGNALAVNDVLAESLDLEKSRKGRLPNKQVAEAFKQLRKENKKATYVAVPHLLSTHTVVLYSYLKKFNASLSLIPNEPGDVQAIPIAPPKAPAYIKSKGTRGFPSAFEQSLPWADVVETQGYEKVAWYSKDVIEWPEGHVECIMLASDQALADKFLAVQEVVNAIKQAGQDIENARREGGETLDAIIDLIRQHISLHTAEAIKASLDHELRVINYRDLHIDKPGLKIIMDLAVEGKILRNPLNLDEFADPRFVSNTTDRDRGASQ